MTRPIRVAHVIGSTGVYGAEGWIFALGRHLPPERVETRIVNLVDETGEPSPLAAEARGRGFAATDLHTGGRFSPRGVIRLARWLRRSEIDVVHTHGYKADVVGIPAARLARARVVATPHGWEAAWAPRLAAYESADRAILRFADAVCPLSPAHEEVLRRARIPARRIRPILNAVDVETVDAIRPASRPPDEVRVGYVGRLTTHKDVGCLVEAFAHLDARHDAVRLVIAGDGPQRDALEARAAERLGPGRAVFVGYRDDAVAVLKSLDLFVLPSLYEGIPRCVMEAMAAGIPVVASDVAGTRLLVRHGDTGLLFPAGDPEQLAAAITALLDAPVLSQTLAKRARAMIETEFSATRMARDYLEVYGAC